MYSNAPTVTMLSSMFLFRMNKPQPPPTITTIPLPTDSLSDQSGILFGPRLLHHLLSGRDWRHTALFPRTTFCRVPGIRLIGVENVYTAQCALPINMHYEKLYIFLWFWMAFVIGASVISLLSWLVLLARPNRRYQLMRESLYFYEGDVVDRRQFASFVRYCGNLEGVFMFTLINRDIGDFLVYQIIYLIYKRRQARRTGAAGDAEFRIEQTI